MSPEACSASRSVGSRELLLHVHLSSDPFEDLYTIHVRAGWPLVVAEGQMWERRIESQGRLIPETRRVHGAVLLNPNRKGLQRYRLFPFSPRLPGLILNSLVYAGVLGAAGHAGSKLIRRRRRRHGLCPGCGYRLEGHAGHHCPECGNATAA